MAAARRLWGGHLWRSLVPSAPPPIPAAAVARQRPRARWYGGGSFPLGRHHPLTTLGHHGIIWKPKVVLSQEWRVILHPITTGKQGFAKVTAVPLQYQRTMRMKFYMDSPGIIFEPYSRPPPALPFLHRWFTKEGWKRRKEWMLDQFKTAYTIARLRKAGYDRAKFYNEACETYKKVNGALAEGDHTTLRQLVTDNFLSLLKKEIKQRESVWHRVFWQCNGPLKTIQTLQGRLAAADKNNLENAIVQLTIRIQSDQNFAAYNKQGRLLAGDPDKKIFVEDIWVFEKLLNQFDAKWKVCGRISP